MCPNTTIGKSRHEHDVQAPGRPASGWARLSKLKNTVPDLAEVTRLIAVLHYSYSQLYVSIVTTVSIRDRANPTHPHPDARHRHVGACGAESDADAPGPIGADARPVLPRRAACRHDAAVMRRVAE